MQEDTKLLLASRFYAYSLGGLPWGLPNHLWSQLPQVLILFDQLVCDEHAYNAESLAHSRLGWVTSGLFVRLKEEGILVPLNTSSVVRTVRPPRRRLEVPGLDKHYSLGVQHQLALPIFDWDRSLLERARTLAPRLASRGQPDRASVKLSYLWSVISTHHQIVPSFDVLPGEEGKAYRKVLKLQQPYWKQIEEIQIDVEEYMTIVEQWKSLYQIIDESLEKIAIPRFETLLRFREKTKEVRSLVRPLVTEAFDDTKSFAAYAVHIQTELAKSIPELFSVSVKAAGKVIIGMATMVSPWVAEYFGYSVPPVVKAGGATTGVAALKSAASNVATRLREQRTANPLKFMVRTARRMGL